MLQQRFGCAPFTLVFQGSYQCVLLHRLAHHFWRRGDRKWARLFTQLNTLLTGADIHPHCDLGGGLLIPHPVALTASGHAGRNLTMMPLSGIGMLPRAKDVGAGAGLPVLGDDVWLGAGCGVLGPVRVGGGTRIRAGAALTRDVPAASIVCMAAPNETALPEAPIEVTSSAPDACRHQNVGASRQALRRDVDRYLGIRDPDTQAGSAGPLRLLGTLLTHEIITVAAHRLAHRLHVLGWRRVAQAVSQLNLLAFRVWIHPASCVGGGFFLPHPAGVVLVAHVGDDLTMYARSLCTAQPPFGPDASQVGPRLGDRVVIAGMAAALGPIAIGDDVRIGFNVQLARDAAAGMSAASAVMRVVVTPDISDGAAPANDAAPERDVPTWADTRQRVREDRARIRALCAGPHAPAPLWPAWLCAALFRLSHHALRHGHRRLSRVCWRLNTLLTGADIDARSDIGGGLVVIHPVGVWIHAAAGRNLTVRALASIGPEVTLPAHAWDDNARPQLGDDVTLDVHASVHGAVHVGSGARLGPGCKVSVAVAAGAALEAVAPRLHRMRAAGRDEAAPPTLPGVAT